MTEPAASGASASADFGLVLRTARDDAGMSQDHVADALHVKVAVVSALEEGRFRDLPIRPYARGYVRNYARILGLDADDLARRFDAADADRPEPSVVVPRHRVTPKSELALRPLALGYAAIVVVLLVALGAVLWTAWRVQDWQLPFLADDSVEPPTVELEPEAESPAGPPNVSPWPVVADGAAEGGAADALAPASADEAPAPLVSTVAETDAAAAPVPADEPTAESGAVGELAPASADEAPAPLVSTGAETDAAAAPVPADEPTAESGVVGELTLVFEADSWVSVDDARGTQLFGGLVRNGRTVTVAGPVPLSVLVGNAPAVRVQFDGESVDLGPFTRDDNVARFEIGGG